MLALILKIDLFLEKYRGLIFLLFIIVILRLPNLSEPYWYGDEGIYLTIGQAMNRGLRLYSEIIDHKTPIIYYLARVHTQLNFRILTIFWMLITTVLYYVFSLKLLKSRRLTFWATLIFAFFTTVPWFEGNIPNGELFVIGFVMAGAVAIAKTRYFNSFFNPEVDAGSKERWGWLLVSGMLFSLAILTKVPAVMDLAAFLSIGFFYLTNGITERALAKGSVFKKFAQITFKEVLIIVGVTLPIVVSVGYFMQRGSHGDYLDYGLLYNFRYAGFWQISFTNPVVLFLFTLPGKTIILASILMMLVLQRSKLSPAHQFVSAWFVLSLFGAMLSNRPYPHYVLQIAPPFSLLVVLGLKNLLEHWRQKKLLPATISFSLIAGTALVLFLFLGVGTYPFISYYRNWWLLITGRLSVPEYRQSFNHLMSDNYAAADMIKKTGEKRLFIWGTNPMLYALSDTTPSGRFTVSFHIKDFKAYEETLSAVKATNPLFIIVMNDETNTFPELQHYLNSHYMPDNQQFDNFQVWKRLQNGV